MSHHSGRATHVQLLIVIALVVLLSSFAYLFARRQYEMSNRVLCAKTLRALGLAMLMYANDNKGALPRTTYRGGPVVKPVWGTGVDAADPFAPGGPAANDITAAWFLVLRTQDITTEILICRSTQAERDRLGGSSGGILARSNFTDVKKNVCYSLHNCYPKDGVEQSWHAAELPAGLAIAADLNPGSRQGNSRNHGSAGQNVLYGDGHVEWRSTPLAGIEHDNIYSSKSGLIIDSPADAKDSVLLPADD